MPRPRTDKAPRGADDSDATLVRRLRAGDRAAAEVLVRRYLRAAWAVALAILGNRADAEDVAQDALMVALERADECREPDRFAGWLMTIVRNRSRNLRDAGSARRTVPWADESMTEGLHAPDPMVGTRTREIAERLLGALAHVSEVQREVVLLHDLEGWAHAEIGTALGLSEVMSRQHLFTAHRRLRERLGHTAPGGHHEE